MANKQLVLKDTEFSPKEDARDANLKIINGINFTSREIDIIACLLGGKDYKKIAMFLCISPKTVEMHTRGIMLKIGCNSRNNIIDFIEKSNKFILIKQHYSNLLIKAAFELELKKIASLTANSINCLLVYDKKEKTKASFINGLEKHLNIANIKTESKVLQKNKSSAPSATNLGSHSIDYVLYIISSEFMEQLKINEYKLEKIIAPTSHKKEKNIFILLDNSVVTELDQQKIDFSYIDFTAQENYYFSLFELLKIIFSSRKIERNLLDFTQNYKKLAIHQLWQQSTYENELSANSAGLTQHKLNKVKIITAGIISAFLFVGMWLAYSTYNSRAMFTLLNWPESITTGNNFFTWNIPRQDHIFIGREKLLKDLHNKLHQNENLKISNTLAVNACAGLGGIGKTTLALQYINHVKYPYRFKAWFHAENVSNLRKEYLEFAKKIGYSSTNADTTDTAFVYVKKWLSVHPGWLIVFDNVNNYHEIADFLPESGGYIILTSRQRDWPANFKMLDVDIMSETEAIQTIKSLVKRNIEQEQDGIKKLAKNLGYLPLALAQAGAYIQQNHVSIAEYLDLYQKHTIELLADETFVKSKTSLPVAITWNISLQAIVQKIKSYREQPIAIELLTVCAYLAPDKISREVLLAWIQETYPELSSPKLVLNKHLSLLWSYSMINYNDNNISIHRLVQTVLRHQLQQSFVGKKNICSTLNLKWYESLLRFFIHHESEFKLNNSFNQLIETSEQFKAKFKHEYNATFAELDLMICSVYFYQEKFDDYFNVLNKINASLQKQKNMEFLKSRLDYLYSGHFRKIGDFETAEKHINSAFANFKKIKPSAAVNENMLKNLYAKILFNKVNLCVVKNKALSPEQRNQLELESAKKDIKQAIDTYNQTHNIRDWLRTTELQGRLLVVANNGDEVIKKFNEHNKTFEETADERTKMLFYITYSEAYAINKNFKKALSYIKRAKHKAANLNLKNEYHNIHNKEQTLKALLAQAK